MENFLDEYQVIRLTMTVGGLALMAILLSVGSWDDNAAPIAIVLTLVAGHAAWCRVRQIRAPKSMLALDLTLWGWVMTLISDMPTVMTASLAFLVLLTVLFADGAWTFVFLPYIVSWYGLAYFQEAGVSSETLNMFLAAVFTVAGLALVMWRVKSWLARLDSNRSQMIGTVSHELRNNLTGMMGMTELVGSEDLDPSEVRELVFLAHMQAVDASEIVEDLLTASRLESAALSVEVSEVDLNAEVETTVRRFAGEGVSISTELDDGLPPGSGDALRVRQVLRNLLSNAVRYGGSSLKVRTDRDTSHLRVIVADDGDGVPSEDEGTIFFPYRRSTTTLRHESSVGLGLWICRQLAHAMGGDLGYRREDGMTEFVFTLAIHSDDTQSDGTTSEDLPLVEAIASRLSALRARSEDSDHASLAAGCL